MFILHRQNEDLNIEQEIGKIEAPDLKSALIQLQKDYTRDLENWDSADRIILERNGVSFYLDKNESKWKIHYLGEQVPIQNFLNN